MKNIFNNYIKPIAKDRLMIVFMLIVFISGLSFFLYMVFNVEQFDQLMYSRYTIYGTEHYYRDRWFYRIIVSLFGLIIAFLHNAIIIKIYNPKNRVASFTLAIFSVIVVVIAFSIMANVLGEIPN